MGYIAKFPLDFRPWVFKIVIISENWAYLKEIFSEIAHGDAAVMSFLVQNYIGSDMFCFWNIRTEQNII